MNNEEKVITFLLSEFNSSQTNVVSIGQNNVSEINLPEEEIIKSLFVLQEDGLISISRKSVNNDFSMFWDIALKSSCIHYFENKKKDKTYAIREFIKFAIPTIISIIALFVAA